MGRSDKTSPSGPKVGFLRSATVTSGTLAAQAITTVTGVTVADARVGDQVITHPNAALIAAGCLVAGTIVTADNTASVSFFNPSGSSVATADYAMQFELRRLSE